jgi:hypothetical protein
VPRHQRHLQEDGLRVPADKKRYTGAVSLPEPDEMARLQILEQELAEP